MRSEKKNIGGLEVTTTQLPAMRGLQLYARLGSAECAVPILATLGKDSSEPMQVLFSAVSSDHSASLMRDILQSTHVIHDGRLTKLDSDEALNRAFSGRLKDLLEVCWFALQVNFADFFEAASSEPSEPEEAVEETEQAEESPSASTKTSRRVRLRGNSSATGG